MDRSCSRASSTSAIPHQLRALTCDEAKLWARTGVLAAFALLLSYIETFLPLPIPVPGAKLGLANAAVLLALKTVGMRGAFIVALSKMLVTGILFGSPIMLPYSAAGTMLSFACMAALIKVPRLSVVLISMFGAIFHVVGQLAVASLMLKTSLVWYSLPLLLTIALVTGALVGAVVRYLIRALSESRSPRSASAADEASPAVYALENPEEAKRDGGDGSEGLFPLSSDRAISSPLAKIDPRAILVGMTIYAVCVFLIDSIIGLIICTAAAAAAAFAARLKPTHVLKALVPLLSILLITAIAQIAYAQQGDVVATIGPVSITSEAIRATIVLFFRLVCLMVAGAAVMHAIDAQKLLDMLKSLLIRCKRFGIKADALVITLDLAIGFVPTLIDRFHALCEQRRATDPQFATGTIMKKIKDQGSLMAPLAREAFAHADNMAEDLVAPVSDAAAIRDASSVSGIPDTENASAAFCRNRELA